MQALSHASVRGNCEHMTREQLLSVWRRSWLELIEILAGIHSGVGGKPLTAKTGEAHSLSCTSMCGHSACVHREIEAQVERLSQPQPGTSALHFESEHAQGLVSALPLHPPC